MYKNETGQSIRVLAFNATTNLPFEGDAANITCKLSKGGALTPVALFDTNPVEQEDGYYLFSLTQDETDADTLDFFPDSSTANIVVIVPNHDRRTDIRVSSSAAPAAPTSGSVPFSLDGPVVSGGGSGSGGFSQATVLDELQPIIQGDDLTISFTIPAPAEFTNSAVVTFGGHKAYCGAEDIGWLVTGVITVVGLTWVLTFTLANAITDALDETAAYHWSVQVTEAGIERTIKKSNLKRPVRVIPKQT